MSVALNEVDTKSIQKVTHKVRKQLLPKIQSVNESMNYACVITLNMTNNTHRHKHTYKEIKTRIFISI